MVKKEYKTTQKQRDYAKAYQRNKLKDPIERAKQNKRTRDAYADPVKRAKQKARLQGKKPLYRIKLIHLLGGVCKRCGFSDIRALQLDHINGGGLKEQKKLGTHVMYRKYLLDLAKAKACLQVLCANCNWIKRHTNSEKPKGRPRKYE